MSACAEAGEATRVASEADAVRRLGEGDTSALAELVERHGEDLMRYLVSILGTREEAEDVFQETWVKVLRTARRFDAGRAAAPWIFRIARNRAYDRLRWRRRWRLLGIGGGEEGTVPEPVHDAGFDDRVSARFDVAAMLGRLDPPLREVVWLRFGGERSLQEIASICRLPLGTVKSRLHRAMNRLAIMARRAEEEADGCAAT